MRCFEVIAVAYVLLSLTVLGAYELRKHHERVECTRALSGRTDPEIARKWCAKYVRRTR